MAATVLAMSAEGCVLEQTCNCLNADRAGYVADERQGCHPEERCDEGSARWRSQKLIWSRARCAPSAFKQLMLVWQRSFRGLPKFHEELDYLNGTPVESCREKHPEVVPKIVRPGS